LSPGPMSGLRDASLANRIRRRTPRTALMTSSSASPACRASMRKYRPLIEIFRLETRTEVHDKMPPRCRPERTGAVEFEDEARGIHARSETRAPQLPRGTREGERRWRHKTSPVEKREQANRQQPVTKTTSDDRGERRPRFEVHDRD